MKKISVAVISVLMLLGLCATPVFATDPPDTEVDVTVVTPGDVDLDVGINAGGNVDVTVDGVDMKQTADTANHALGMARSLREGGGINTHDWYRYWSKEIAPYQELLNNMDSAIGIIANAEAMLIKGHELTKEEIASINEAVSIIRDTTASLDTAVASLEAETSGSISALQARDDEIWEQLMYGAEAHIAILDAQLAVQEGEVSNLQSDLSLVKAQLETAGANNYALRNYVDYLQRQYMYYFWIIGGVLGLLSILLIVSLRRKSL